MKKPANFRSYFSGPLVSLLGLLCILGIAILFALLSSYKSYVIPKEDRVPANAVVTQIQRISSGRSYRYMIFVRYTVDGQEFESKSRGDFSSKIHAEDTVPIYYDRNHPFKVMIRDTSSFRYEFLAGALFIAVPVFAVAVKVIKYIRSARREKA